MPIQVRSGDQPDAFGDWHELIAATAYTAVGYHVVISVDLGQQVAVDVGTGPAGQEVSRGTHETARSATILVPHDPLPGGTRVAARVKSRQAHALIYVQVYPIR